MFICKGVFALLHCDVATLSLLSFDGAFASLIAMFCVVIGLIPAVLTLCRDATRRFHESEQLGA